MRSRILVLLLLCACSSEGTENAPPPLPGAEPAAPSAAEPAAGGGPQNPLAALQALTAMGEQAQKAITAGEGAAVTNWRDLAPFLADALAGFKADGDVDGSTTGMEGFKVTTVKRQYKTQGAEASVEIVDTSYAPMLRAPFAMVSMIQEDSSHGFKRGGKLKEQPSISEWDQRQKQSQVHALVGERFLVNIEVSGAAQPRAEDVFNAVDVSGLVSLAAKSKTATK